MRSMRAAEMLSERVREATPEQRAAVIERPKDIRTMRKGIRRTLEHDWEHYLELSRRTGGPAIVRLAVAITRHDS